MNTMKSVPRFRPTHPFVWQIILLFIALIFSFIATKTNSFVSGKGLQVSDSTIILQEKDGITDTKVIKYSVTLQNSESYPVAVDTLVPVVNGDVLKIVSPEDTQVVVEKPIKPGGTLVINDQLQFDLQGVTKDQISHWDHLITGFKVTTEQVLPATP